jgi:hypothetical protein
MSIEMSPGSSIVHSKLRSKNKHQIIRQNWMENPKKINPENRAPRELLFLTKCGSKKNRLYSRNSTCLSKIFNRLKKFDFYRNFSVT